MAELSVHEIFRGNTAPAVQHLAGFKMRGHLGHRVDPMTVDALPSGAVENPAAETSVTLAKARAEVTIAKGGRA